MSQWSGSEYQGPKTHDWEEGFGKFTFPNDVIYEGNFNKGEFHGDGTLIYPNGVSRREIIGETALFNVILFLTRGVTSPNGTEESLLKETTTSMTTLLSKTRSGPTQLRRTEVSTLKSLKVSVQTD